MPKADRWMPILIADFIIDTAVFPLEQQGAYVRLLIHQWRDGAVPDNPEQLARLCNLRPDRYGKVIRPVLEKFFTLGADGMWRDEKYVAERARADANYVKAVTKGKKGALLRWRPKAE